MSRKKQIYITRCAVFALMFVGVFYVKDTIDHDVFFILHGGDYVLKHGIPHVEPFTVHENMHFIMQQWMTGVVFFKVFAYFGSQGLLAMIKILSVATIICHFAMLRTAGANRYVAAFAAMTTGIFICYRYGVARPQIISTLLFMVEVWCLLKYRRVCDWRYLLPLPLLSVLTINFHAAVWPLLFVFWLPFAAAKLAAKHGGELFVRPKPKVSCAVLLAFCAAMFLGGFVNPYGAEAMVYGFNSYDSQAVKSVVSEMLPLYMLSLLGKTVLFTLLLSVGVAMRRAVPMEYFLLTLGTGYMTIGAVRNASLFFIFGTFTVAYALSRFRLFGKLRYGRQVLYGSLALTFLFYVPIRSEMDMPIKYEYYYKPMARLLLDENRKSAVRVFNGYDGLGAYLEFFDIPCYMDARAEIFLKNNNRQKNILNEYDDLRRGRVYYRDFFAMYDFTHAVVSDDDWVYGALVQELANDDDFELLAVFSVPDEYRVKGKLKPDEKFFTYYVYRIKDGAFYEERKR